MSSAVLDLHSKKLLIALQEDSRRTLQDLAAAVGLSQTPCWRRVKAMEEAGVITGYRALLSREKLGLDLCVSAHISIARHVPDAAEIFERMVLTAREVIECHVTAGDADYIMTVLVPDTHSYDRFLQDKIFPLQIVGSVRSNIALREVKARAPLPI